MGCVGSHVDVEADGRQYHLKRLIATGDNNSKKLFRGFSKIYLGEDLESGKKVAVKKILCHSASEIERTYREVAMHRTFTTNRSGDHESVGHIMQIIAVGEERISSSGSLISFSLIFPLCKLGSMQDELTSRRTTKEYIPQGRIMCLFRQVCTALHHLHSLMPPIAHRDLKPANLLLRSVDALLLTDFGSAVECPIRISDAFQRRSMLDEAAELCTMPYRAPELFTCDTGTVLDVSVDIWSLGCVLYALCYFCSPYDVVHERGDSIALAVQSAKLNFDRNAPIDEWVTLLISALIKFDPSERLRIVEVLRRLDDYGY